MCNASKARSAMTNYVVAYPPTCMASRERKDAMGRGLRLVPKLPPFHRGKAFCQPLLQPYGAPFLAEFVGRTSGSSTTNCASGLPGISWAHAAGCAPGGLPTPSRGRTQRGARRT